MAAIVVMQVVHRECLLVVCASQHYVQCITVSVERSRIVEIWLLSMWSCSANLLCGFQNIGGICRSLLEGLLNGVAFSQSVQGYVRQEDV